MAKKIFKVNAKRNLAALKSDSRFVDLKPDSTLLFHFASSTNKDGATLFPVFNHYKLKNPDHGGGMALADLSLHGTEETGDVDYIAELSDYLKSTDDEKLVQIGEDIEGNTRTVAQGWSVSREEGGLVYSKKAQIITMAKTLAGSLEGDGGIAEKNEMMGEARYDDPNGGQPLLLTRKGSGFQTKYSVERSGTVVNLDEVLPGWLDTLFDDVYDAVILNIKTREEQRQIAEFSYPKLDWEAIDAAVTV